MTHGVTQRAAAASEKTAPDFAVDLCRQGEALVVLHLQKL